MKRVNRKAVILAACVVCGLVFTWGCEKENVRMGKLIANENRQLKDQLNEKQAEIDNQKQLLNKCLEEKKVLQQQQRKGLEDMLSQLAGGFMQENRKLQDENAGLKRQIEELKRQAGPQSQGGY